MASTEQAILELGLQSLQAGRLEDAERSFKKVLRRQPRHIGALNLVGIVLTRLEKYQEAETFIKIAIKSGPPSDATFYNYAIVLKNLGQFEAAYSALTSSLEINPKSADTWNNRGAVLKDLSRFDEAMADFDQAIALKPDYAEAYANKGNSFRLNRSDLALSAFETALRISPQLAEAWLGRGNVLAFLKRHDDALASFDMALKLKPDLYDACIGRGDALYELRQYEDALAAYEAAIRIKPDAAAAWVGRGNSFNGLGRFEDAADAFAAAIKVDPARSILRGNILHARAQSCQWQNFAEDTAKLVEDGRRGVIVSSPFEILSTTASSADQLKMIASCVSERLKGGPGPLWTGERYEHSRIRIAYLSADFHEHPVSQLMAGVFERHDRSRFEVFAFSYGPDSDSPMRVRLTNAFEHFVDVRLQSSQQIAELIRKSEIDIVIDLTGYTGRTRPEILAMRPAPVQANYLGYPGTMGMDFMDYIVADAFVIPPGDEGSYAENVVRLPHAFMPTDATSPVASTPTRAEAGLPPEGVVFCAFNTNFKIMPEIFDVWMQLLADVDGSVLWLRSAKSNVVSNLRAEAQKRGVAPERLIFAPFVKGHAEHLARHRLADLYLDTIYYNAHTTAVDALWAGLPVLTCAGSTFAGRVAGSLLRAAGLPELVTTSLDAYRNLALSLVRDPPRLAALKQKLADARPSCPLFDTAGFTRHLEDAYQQMWQIQQAGESPRALTIGT